MDKGRKHDDGHGRAGELEGNSAIRVAACYDGSIESIVPRSPGILQTAATGETLFHPYVVAFAPFDVFRSFSVPIVRY
jgi:hypothetical protein